MSSPSSSSASSVFSDSELHSLRQLIAAGLSEDVGSGDITTLATISDHARATATFLAKQDGVLSGIAVAEMVLHTVDNKLSIHWTAKDGDFVKAGTKFGTVHGKAYSILVAERLALNILQRMSGIATTTRHYVQAMGSDQKCKVLDTRKTAPGMRLTDKLAVKHGGGENHRFGLYDMFLVKDNHIDTNGGVRNALAKVKSFIDADLPRRQHLKIEIEARTLAEVSEIVAIGGVDRILLDNMVKVKRDHDGKIVTIDTSLLEQAVTLIGGKIKTEASGNVNIETIAAIAKTGVDFVSVGALTHSVNAMDISLKISDVE